MFCKISGLSEFYVFTLPVEIQMHMFNTSRF